LLTVVHSPTTCLLAKLFHIQVLYGMCMNFVTLIFDLVNMHFWTRSVSWGNVFLSRVSILTRDIDIANLSVCPSVRYVPVSDENGLT